VSKYPRKLLLIGLDAPIMPRVYSYAMEGKLPTIRRLIDRGTWGTQCLVPYPTITPPNWTTIVTGAWPGTHGVTDFNAHIPGDPLDHLHQAFSSADCQAEYIWDAAERVGVTSVVLNYPTTWPTEMKEGILIGGAGLHINEWRTDDAAAYHRAPWLADLTWGFRKQVSLASDQCFASEDYPLAVMSEVEDAVDWDGAPTDALEASIPLRYRDAQVPVAPEVWHLLILAGDSGEYDRALLCTERNARSAIAELVPGKWSDAVSWTFRTPEGDIQGVFLLKLMELSTDGQDFKLYMSPICRTDGWTHPAEWAEKIGLTEGLPYPGGGNKALKLDWIDLDTWVEILEMDNRWLAHAARVALTESDADLFFMHAHSPDEMYHAISTFLDPSTAKGIEDIPRFQDAELHVYQSLDRMIETILSTRDMRHTLVILVSDHGAKPARRKFLLRDMMTETGFLVSIEDERTGTYQVEWSRTRAIPQRSCYIYVNLKGRDPDGIVEPGAEYEKLCEEIIDMLYAYRDPQTGKRPVVLALKREDARVLGLHGDRIGDVVYALSPEFLSEHGPFLPTATNGIGDLRGLFLMAGPGVKKGYIMERTMSLTDIVPTICHLMGLPVPREVEGGILYQALRDPDGKHKQMEKLRRNYERLKNAVESEQALTHTYFMK